MTTNTSQITIGIKGIKFLHFETTTRVQEIKKQLPDNAYEFQFDLQSDINESEKLFNLLLTAILYEKQSTETKVKLATIGVTVSFIVVNFNEVIKKENGLIAISDQLIAIASGIVLSTARGMFAINTKDSIISNAIIPIVNPQAFIPKKV